MQTNAIDLRTEFLWFREVLKTRITSIESTAPLCDLIEEEAPKYSENSSVYAQFLNKFMLGLEERVTLLLALAPCIHPHVLDIFFLKNSSTERFFTQFGGIKDNDGGFIPTGETLAFLLGGCDFMAQYLVYPLLAPDHIFSRFNVIKLDAPQEGRSILSGRLKLSPDIVHQFTLGTDAPTPFSFDFPAQKVVTELAWEDLVVEPSVHSEIEHIATWLSHHHTLTNEWDLGKKIRPGFRCLLYGPPGTGKTLTASLLGKSTGRDVYKIDLSMVISKYIGETEKNLNRIFEKAETKNWILFFDEADALFGKRTDVRDSHDRYANQEVSYLLQRVETYNGVIILASNFQTNLDEAFSRRFESIIHLPMPEAEERLKLWQQSFPEACRLEDKVNLKQIANEYEITGGTIMNVVHYCCLQALKRDSKLILHQDLFGGLRREYHKVGRIL